MGKDLKPISEADRIDVNKIKGCQSQVWLVPAFEEGHIIFNGDSDASIVKGIVGILLYVYSGSTPDDILATKPDFIEQIGLREHLSMMRANGLSSMLKQIMVYAMAFKAKLNLGIK